MINFWQMALSDLLLNMNRGTFAEFIVRCALETGGFPALSESRSGIESYDITGPKCFTTRGESECRIEVKSAASIQKTTPDEKEPLSLPPNRIVFSIKKAINFNTADKIPRRNNDMYVFCHYKAERKSDNIFDLALWDFYVLYAENTNSLIMMNMKYATYADGKTMRFRSYIRTRPERTVSL